MAEPTVVYIWASTAASTTSTPSPAVQVGDLCIVWKSGSPASVGTGVPTGFTTAESGTSNNGTGSKASMFYRVLTSGDITSGNLNAVSLNVGGTTTLRIGLAIFRHASGFDQSTTLLYHNAFNTNTSPPAVVATMTDVASPVVAFSVCTGSGSSQQYTWAGAPTGNTATRDPYNDDSSGASAQYTQGGHGASRGDVTGVTINSGSTSHLDSNMIAADLGSGIGGGAFTAGTYVTSVTPGVGFTSSTAATTGASTVSFTSPHYGTGAATLQADYQTFDASDTPGNVTLQTSTAANGYVAITAEFQVQTPTKTGTALLAGAGTFAATGTPTTFGTSVLSGNGAFAAAGTPTVHGTTVLTGGGTFHADQQGVTTITGVAALVGTGTFSATGGRIKVGTAVLTGGGTFSTAGTRVVRGTSVLTGTVTFHGQQRQDIVTYQAGGTWSSSSVLLVGGRTQEGFAALTGGGTFGASGRSVANGQGLSELIGGGTFTAAGLRTVIGTALLDGGGEFDAIPLTLSTNDRLTLNRDSTLVLDRSSTLTLGR